MLDPFIVKTKYIDPSLADIRMLNDDRSIMLLCVGAVESDMGKHPKQLEGGPALGFYGMEPTTYHCMRKNVLPVFWDRIQNIYFPKDANFLIYDLRLATYAAALQFARFKEPLPSKHDAVGQAAYWKKYWNTEEGKGTEEEFLKKREIYVGPLLRRD